MSWFARSLANAFAPETDESSSTSTTTAAPAVDGVEGSEIMSPRGVKEDLSEITKTLTRQLWGVASFLAPPPESPSPESGSSPSSTAPGSHHSDLVKSDKEEEEEEEGDLPGFAGIRSDFAEIGGRFKSGISKLSSNKAVSEISKIATSFLPFGAEEEEEEEEVEEDGGSTEGAIGITEEVLTFARNISMHPETWLDFPLLPEEEDSDDFDMSDAQQDHALAVEHLAPRLAALRIELCPSHMSEGCFWKIYFVLLHPRLNKEDAERLSTPQIKTPTAYNKKYMSILLVLLRESRVDTGILLPVNPVSVELFAILMEGHHVLPFGTDMISAVPVRWIAQYSQIVEARAMLLQELQNRTSELQKKSGSTSSYRKEFATSTPNDEETTPSSGYREGSALKTMAPEEPASFYTDSETEKHPVITTEIKIVDKSVVKEELQYQPKSSSSDGSRVPIHGFEDEGDDWLEDEGMNLGISTITHIPPGTEEDVSFSDLEDEDDRVTPAGGSRKEIHSFSSKTKDSKDWVELSKGPGNFPKEGKAASSENESNEWLDIEDIDLA